MERLLIVEGEEDKKFFEAVFRAMDRADEVAIRHHPSGKSNAISLFGAALERLTRASNASVGLVVDADDPALNATDGFLSTRRLVNKQLQLRHFAALTPGPGTSGLLAHAPQFGAVRAGLWVMPDNHSNGYLEDFANAVVAHSEKPRQTFASAISASVSNGGHGGPAYAFKAHHLSKATIGTWLAWSDPPRMNLGTAVSRGLLDVEHARFQSLIAWLNLLYF
jgi:hypothetical protein